jgi:hypothetical protein
VGGRHCNLRSVPQARQTPAGSLDTAKAIGSRKYRKHSTTSASRPGSPLQKDAVHCVIIVVLVYNTNRATGGGICDDRADNALMWNEDEIELTISECTRKRNKADKYETVLIKNGVY